VDLDRVGSKLGTAALSLETGDAISPRVNV
jgi:hypothetical protein